MRKYILPIGLVASILVGCTSASSARQQIGGIVVHEFDGCWPVMKLLSVDEMEAIERICCADDYNCAEDSNKGDGLGCERALLYEYEVFGIARGNVFVKKYLFREDFGRVRVFKRHLPTINEASPTVEGVQNLYVAYEKPIKHEDAVKISEMSYYYEDEDEEKRRVDCRMEDLDYGLFPSKTNIPNNTEGDDRKDK